MVFSYNWLQSFFERKISKPEKLADFLTMKSFEVESIEKIGDDFGLNIEVLPNRGPDCFSHLGIAREVGAILGYELVTRNYPLKEDKSLKTKDFLKVEVKNKNDCYRYIARTIFDVKIDSSPKWIREKLLVCGLRPINNVVDILNYVMLETGQPLHAFDFDKIAGKKIIVRKAQKGEKIITFDNEKYELDKEVLVIADDKTPLAIAGIKGGKKAEISKRTKRIVLESANFNQKTIRAGSKKIDLKTDASWRFEHGIDPNLAELAINQASYLIQEIAGGNVCQGFIDFYPKKLLPKKIRLDLDYVENLLGVKIAKKEIEDILKRLKFKVSQPLSPSSDNTLIVEVPTFRLDISLAEDLIEEIARLYGYQKIPLVFPTVTLIPPQKNLNLFWEKIAKDTLKEAGLTETYNYSFIGEREKEIFNFKDLIELENPTSADYKYLRPSLIPHLLKNIQKNQRFLKEIKIFELGKIYKRPNFEEKRRLTGAIRGKAFFEAKGVVDFLFQNLGIAQVWYDGFQPTPEETEISIWHPLRCAEIKVNHEEVGFLGEIAPKITDFFKIEDKVTIFDLDFEKLSRLASEEAIYQPISSYPAAIRDLSVLVPRRILADEVLNEIERSGGELLRDVDLFDIYEGEELPEGMKNLTFHLIYQARDRVLSSKEIEQIQQNIIKTLEENGWQVRK